MPQQIKRLIIKVEQKLVNLGYSEYEKSGIPNLQPEELGGYYEFLIEKLEVAESGMAGSLLQSGRNF